MASLLLKARMALELPAINRALDSLLTELPEPSRPAATHMVTAGGKRLRPLLTILCARMLGHGRPAPEGDLHRLAGTLEMLHAATLMHDDVIDNADTRRGKPATHVLFDNVTAILAGDALLATANACVAEYGDPRLCRIFATATAETAAGEILELHSLRNPDLDEDAYRNIIRGKTALLIRSACELGATYAGGSKEEIAALATFGENVGMAFQMVDDALDVADTAVTGKPSGGDLREGKLTPPLRLYRNSLDAVCARDFDAKFTKGSFTDEEISAVCQAVRENGFDRAVRGMAETYLDKARSALAQLPACSERDILHEILTYVRDRKK